MQHRGCEQIQLLLSRFADGEADPSERQRVESHLAGCADCSNKLAEYNEIHTLLSGAPRRDPEPALRVDLFRQIKRIQEEEEQEQRRSQERPVWLPQRPDRRPTRASRFWTATSPFVAASAAVFAILGLAFFLGNARSPQKTPEVLVYPLAPVGTVEAPVGALDQASSDVPPPESTQSVRVNGSMSPSVPADLAGATAFATAIAEGVFQLSAATPVMEEGDPRDLSSWHSFTDPSFGYAVSYPPNWWTFTRGDSRMFAPWWADSPQGAPYWIDLRIQANNQALNAETANARMFSGSGTIIRDGQGRAVWVRLTSSDRNARYDALYSFDRKNIYILRLGVSVSRYWQDADRLFSRMSGTFSLPESLSSPVVGYAPVLFLNGSDLFMIEPDGTSRALTHGYGVREFALSPDMRTVVFASSSDSSETWASSLYTVQIDGDTVGAATLLWGGAQEIHDVVWYDDHAVFAIAKSTAAGFGLFRIPFTSRRDNITTQSSDARLITLLPDTMTGARGLSVSPDRQLITFLAPLGLDANTDVYAVRPDGQDLRLMISHADPVSPSDDQGRIYTTESQAIKSYVWVDGHLGDSGYNFHMLLTCGNATSPTFFRGGFLYSSPGAMSTVLLNQNRLSISDANKMQIVHMAYSGGKLAMTGYYNDRDGRADVLAGLWIASIAPSGALEGLRSLPVPASPHGIADLQWSPDGKSLIYRETVPLEASSLSSRYDAGSQSPFSIVKLDPASGERSVLYSSH